MSHPGGNLVDMSERELLATVYWTVAKWMRTADGAHRALDPAVVQQLRHRVARAVAEPDRDRAEALVLAHVQQVRSHRNPMR
jgi:hypothetical protein